MFHPTRGGTRGGRDQFSWEDVKNDKHRENYLGHSLMAPVGRWQKGKDLTWYAKSNEDDVASAKKSELAKIKEAEADAMAIALGVRKKKTLESNVTEEDLKHALNKDNDDSDDNNDLEEGEKGLGYGKSSGRFLGIAGQSQVEVMNGSSNYNAQNHAVQQQTEKTIEEESRIKRKSKKDHKHKKERKKHHRDNSPDSRHRHHKSSRNRSHSPHRRSRRDDSREDKRSRRDGSREDRRSRRDDFREDKRSHRDNSRGERRGHRDGSREERRRHRNGPREERHESRERARHSRRDSSEGEYIKRKRSPSPVRRSLSPYSKRVLLSQKS